MAKKKKVKTKTSKKEPVKVDVKPVKWQAGDERKPQGYWTSMYKTEYDDIASRLIAVGFSEMDLSHTTYRLLRLKGGRGAFRVLRKRVMMVNMDN